MNPNLELVETSVLIDELIRRHDAAFLVFASYRQEAPAISKWVAGRTLEVVGLVETALHEMLQELYEASAEDCE